MESKPPGATGLATVELLSSLDDQPRVVRLPRGRYLEEPGEIPAGFSQLLEHYSNISPSEQVAHITQLRDAAYKVHQYPCLGLFAFLRLALSQHPLYQKYVLPTLLSRPLSADIQGDNQTSGDKVQDLTDESAAEAFAEPVFLDVGTCLGQDLRKLIFDGVSPSRVFGADLLPEFVSISPMLLTLSIRSIQYQTSCDILHPFLHRNNHFAHNKSEEKSPNPPISPFYPHPKLTKRIQSTTKIDLGYKLFGDEDKFPRTQQLSPANVFDGSPDNVLSVLDGRVHILQANSVFHLFELEEQIQCARRCLRLLDLASTTSNKKTLILGMQNGNRTPGLYPRHTPPSADRPPSSSSSLSSTSTYNSYRHNPATWQDFWSVRMPEVLRREESGTTATKVIHFDPHCHQVEVNAGGNVSWRGEGHIWLVWWVWVWLE